MSDIIKSDFDALEKIASQLVGSRYCSEKNAADALWIVATGQSLGLDPVTSLRGIHIIKGKPTLSADLMAGAALRHPACLRFQVTEMTAERATVEVMRKGWAEPSTYTFDKADAQRAGLWGKGTWRSYPADMLKARAISRAARAAFPDALLGVYVEGELDGPADDEPPRAHVVDMPAPKASRVATAEDPPVDAQIVEADVDEQLDRLGVILSRASSAMSEEHMPLDADAYTIYLMEQWNLTDRQEFDGSKLERLCDKMEGASPETVYDKVATATARF